MRTPLTVQALVFSSTLAMPRVSGAVELEQTSWDSTGVAGPVREWGGAFLSSSGIDWQSEPGSLSLDRLGTCMMMGSVGAGVAQVLCADIDGDGDDDIAALDSGGAVVWYENPGDGRSFVIHSVQPAPGPGRGRMALLDADGDGDLDLAASCEDRSQVSLYRNDGYDPWAGEVIVAGTDGIRCIAVLDADNDCDPDLAAGMQPPGGIVWLENTGMPGSSWPVHQLDLGAASPWFLDASDMDLDGDADILAASPGTGEILLCEQVDGDWRRSTTAVLGDPVCARFADLDGIGALEAAACSSTGDLVMSIHRSGGEWRAEAAGTGLIEPVDLVACDIDGDGDDDIAAVSRAAGELAWWQNLGDGEFAPRSAGAAPGLSTCSAGDIDGDGLPEIVTGALETGSICWWEVMDRAVSGTLVSSILYLGSDPVSGRIESDADIPAGTRVDLSVRVSSNRLQMGEWAEVPAGGLALEGLLARGGAFLQYRLTLYTTVPARTPVVRRVLVLVE